MTIQLDEQELGALESAHRFDDVAKIAITMLARHRHEGQNVSMICGPMTTGGCGSFEANMEHFRKSVKVAVRYGLFVFDQTLFQDAMIRISNWKSGAAYPQDVLEIFYRNIFESGHVDKLIFLPDWESSKGARWERSIAADLNLPIEEFPSKWLDEISG